MPITKEQQALIDSIRSGTPGMVQTAMDSLMGAGVTGASRSMASLTSLFPKEFTRVVKAEGLTLSKAAAAAKKAKRGLPKSQPNTQSAQDTLKSLLDSMGGVPKTAAELKAARIARATGNAVELAKKNLATAADKLLQKSQAKLDSQLVERLAQASSDAARRKIVSSYAETLAKANKANKVLRGSQANAKEVLAGFTKQRPTMQQLLSGGEQASVPLGEKVGVAVGQKALTASAVAATALTAGSTPTNPVGVPTSLNPEKRKQEAMQAATTVHPADKPVLEHKPNQEAAKKAAEVNNLPDPTPYFSGKLADLKPEDYVAVVADSRPGQSVYTLTEAGRKKMGYKKGKGVHLSSPNGKSTNAMDTATSLFFNLPNDKVSMEPPITPEQLTITEADTPEQALQKASALKDSVYREALQKRQQESTTLQDLRALQDRARQYAAAGDTRAKSDLPEFDAQIAQAMDRIDLRAQSDATNNLEVINAMNGAKFSLTNAAKTASNASKMSDELTKLTGIPKDYAHMLMVAPIAKAQVTKWLFDRQTQGEPKLISTAGLNDVYNNLTTSALKKTALQNKDNMDLVNAELGLVSIARTTAIANFLKTGQGLKSDNSVNTASFISDYQTRAKGSVLSQIIASAKGIDFTDSPSKDIDRMLKAGKTEAEIKSALVQALSTAQVDTVATNIGLREDAIRMAAQVEVNKYFPPASLFTATHQDIRALLQGAI